MGDARRLRAINQTRDAVLIERGSIADNPWTRLRGLLGRRELAQGDGLLLRPDNSIHTLGMQFAIDVLFLDPAGRVAHLIPEMPPLRVSPIIFRARAVLELFPGTIAHTGTSLGDQIVLIIS